MSELSIWRGTARHAAFPVLEGKTEADVAIVGDQILGRDNAWSDIYRANRMAPVKAAKGGESPGLPPNKIQGRKSLAHDFQVPIWRCMARLHGANCPNRRQRTCRMGTYEALIHG